MRKRVIWAVLATIGVVFVAVSIQKPAKASPDEKQASSDMTLLGISSEAVEIEFHPPRGSTGILEAELYNLNGTLLAKVTRRHKAKPLKVTLYAQINKEAPADYYIRYRFDSNEDFRRRSLMFVGEILETTVLGQRQFVAGTSPVIRVIVRDRAGGGMIQGADITVELVHDDRVISKFHAKSDKNGEVAAPLYMPDMVLGDAKLRVVVISKTAKDVVEETVKIRSALRTLLTTDKPLYQPGQTIHIRALTLSQPSMRPLSQAEVVFEVEDAKGNKVFKKSKKSDEYGISHADFVLADELNMGQYRIRAIAAGMKEEKTVTVQRYVLPKFKVNFKSDRAFYQPGELVKGEIQADYFFGKPVAGGRVQIKCSRFDVSYVDFEVIEGRTDENGHYSFQVRLPEHFVGQPLEAGRASVKFEVSVTDTADHKETITKNVSVSAWPVIIAAVPESGQLIPGLDNKIYIVTTYADSTPARKADSANRRGWLRGVYTPCRWTGREHDAFGKRCPGPARQCNHPDRGQETKGRRDGPGAHEQEPIRHGVCRCDKGSPDLPDPYARTGQRQGLLQYCP